MVGSPDGKKIEDMYNRLDTIPACDRRMDERTSCRGTVRAMHTRRAIKMTSCVKRHENQPARKNSTESAAAIAS